MFRFLKTVAIVILILVVIAVAVPFLVPAEKMKGLVLTQVEEILGRKVSMNDISLSVFPNIAFKATNVKVANPAWANGGDFATIKTLRVGVELMPLLHKQVHVTELALEEPVIVLIQKGTEANWQLGANKPAAPAQKPAGQNVPANPPQDVALNDVTIKNGTLIYKNAPAADMTVSDVNMHFKAASGMEKVTLAGSAVYMGKKTEIDLVLGKALSILSGKPADVALKAVLDGMHVDWQGTLALEKGIADAQGTLHLDQIDASAPAKAQSGKPAATGAAPVTPMGHWSDTPINLGSLAAANAKLAVTIDKILLPKTTLTDIHAAVHLENGALTVNIPRINAYGGTLQLDVGATRTNHIHLAVVLADVEAEPLLHDFSGFDKITGKLGGHVTLDMAGASERALVSNLSGKGDFSFKDGTFKGIDMGALARGQAGAGAVSDARATAFTTLSGSFTIAGGIASNHDLALASAVLHASGDGVVDMPNWQVHYVLKPMLVANAQATDGATGITIPVRVEGALDAPSYRPDVQGAITENLKDPKQLKSNLKQIKKNLLNKDALNGLLR